MRCLVILVFFASSAGLASPLFDNDEVVELTLEGPLSTTFKDIKSRNEQPFALNVEGAVMDVAVRIRGISRIEACRFPPLRLNFSSSETTGTVFSGQGKLKLVTHCRNSPDFEKNVLEEYAAYRIFNVLSDVSFRTRLVRIRYIDTDDPGAADLVRYAFFIEPDKALAKRHNGSLIKTRRVNKTVLDKYQAGSAFVFHYLIGNTDWGLVRAIDADTCCHNGKLIGIGGRHFYVPYDFDMAGLVNARYAKPNPSLRIRRVTQRRYRGYCMPSGPLKKALQAVVRRHDDIIGVIKGLPRLSAKDIKSRAGYLEGFFDSAAKEDELLQRFEKRCL